MPLLSQATTWAPAGGMPTASQPNGGRMSPSHPADTHSTLPKPGSLPGTVNKSDVLTPADNPGPRHPDPGARPAPAGRLLNHLRSSHTEPLAFSRL